MLLLKKKYKYQEEKEGKNILIDLEQFCSLKEVIQPQVPLRLPCYDFTPVIGPAVDAPPLKG